MASANQKKAWKVGQQVKLVKEIRLGPLGYLPVGAIGTVSGFGEDTYHNHVRINFGDQFSFLRHGEAYFGQDQWSLELDTVALKPV